MTLTPAQRRWNALIDQQEAEGLSNDEFAARHGLNVRTLCWYRCKLGRSDRNQPRRIASRYRQKAATTFVEVEVQAEKQQSVEEPTVVLALENYAAHVVIDEETDLWLLRQFLEECC